MNDSMSRTMLSVAAIEDPGGSFISAMKKFSLWMVSLNLSGTPQGVAGVTFTPMGPTGDAVGEPFYYDAATEQYSLDLEATTGAPTAVLLPLAEGGFTEVTSGEQQFEFGGTAGDCSRPSWGWPVDGAPNTIRVPVREGFITYGSMICD
jgi:hypothetical protein